MASEEPEATLEVKKKILQIFKDFMAEIMKLEELGNAGSRFLRGFQQGLGFLQRHPINNSSELIKTILKSNETRRLKLYVEAGCFNTNDASQSFDMSRSILNELERLLNDATNTIETTNKLPSPMDQEMSDGGLLHVTTDNDELVSSCLQEPETTDFAFLMAINYGMVKQNYVMQENIITSLSFKTSSEELETYTLMWNLQPFVKDDVLSQSWKLIP